MCTASQPSKGSARLVACLAGLLACQSSLAQNDPIEVVKTYWAAVSCGRYEEAADQLHPQVLASFSAVASRTLAASLASGDASQREMARSYYSGDPAIGNGAPDGRKVVAGLLRAMRTERDGADCGQPLLSATSVEMPDGSVAVRVPAEPSATPTTDTVVRLKRVGNRFFLSLEK